MIAWKRFKIKDLFETEVFGKSVQVPTGANIKRSDLEDGETPRITVKGINNGVYGKFNCKINTKDYRTFDNFISVSFLGTVFYHPYTASLDMKVHCLKPKNIVLDKYIGQFLVSVIRKSITNTSYSDQISSTVLPEMVLYLPITIEGEPHFEYMRNYMKELEIKGKNKIEKLIKINKD